MNNFFDPPIVLASLAPDIISMPTRQARRVSSTFRCLKRLRPDWENGRKLTKDCIDYIGVAGVDNPRSYHSQNAVTLIFRIELEAGVKFDLNELRLEEFDQIENIVSGLEECGRQQYQQYSLKFYWWPHFCVASGHKDDECNCDCDLSREYGGAVCDCPEAKVCANAFDRLSEKLIDLLPDSFVNNHKCGYEVWLNGDMNYCDDNTIFPGFDQLTRVLTEGERELWDELPQKPVLSIHVWFGQPIDTPE